MRKRRVSHCTDHIGVQVFRRHRKPEKSVIPDRIRGSKRVFVLGVLSAGIADIAVEAQQGLAEEQREHQRGAERGGESAVVPQPHDEVIAARCRRCRDQQPCELRDAHPERSDICEHIFFRTAHDGTDTARCKQDQQHTEEDVGGFGYLPVRAVRKTVCGTAQQQQHGNHAPAVGKCLIAAGVPDGVDRIKQRCRGKQQEDAPSAVETSL